MVCIYTYITRTFTLLDWRWSSAPVKDRTIDLLNSLSKQKRVGHSAMLSTNNNRGYKRCQPLHGLWDRIVQHASVSKTVQCVTASLGSIHQLYTSICLWLCKQGLYRIFKTFVLFWDTADVECIALFILSIKYCLLAQFEKILVTVLFTYFVY